MTTEGLFHGPTSVILIGQDRALLGWVAYALASSCDPAYIWTDVRFAQQSPSADDPMGKQAIPANQLRVLHPSDLKPDNSTANVAVSAVVRADESPENLRRLIDYLRLPIPTQRTLTEPHGTSPLPVVVLSNAHRLAPFYLVGEDISNTVRSIKEAGVVMILTFADAPSGGRLAFETVVHVDGTMRTGWPQATLTVEKGSAATDLPVGTVLRLGDFEPIAAVLRRALG